MTAVANTKDTKPFLFAKSGAILPFFLLTWVSDLASSIPLIGFARLAIMNLEIVVGRQPLSKTETSQTITGLRTRAKLLL